MEDGLAHDFITPCRCDGTTKFVHEECLQRWRAETTNENMTRRCEICMTEYVIVRVCPPETGFIRIARHWRLPLMLAIPTVIVIMVFILRGLDGLTGYGSLSFFHVTNTGDQMRELLKTDIWAIISYYSVMYTYITSMSFFVILKTSTIYLVRKPRKYHWLMLCYDVGFLLTSSSFVYIILLSRIASSISTLYYLGTVAASLNVAVGIKYIRLHNAVLERMNKLNPGERFLTPECELTDLIAQSV